MGIHQTCVRLGWQVVILVLIAFGQVTSVSALPSYDIIFVTQPPFPYDFATANATFGNHRASLDSIPRGGDLYIRYSDGTLRNLTLAAGYGRSGNQGSQGIAVRDPSVSWDGTKALFSMVVGSPAQQYTYEEYRWQLYEISSFGQGQTPIITRVTNQPSGYNNVMPIYASDDSIIFVSDRPRNGAAHLYPQRDEYESTATNTGLWKLNSITGELQVLDHAPSGDFSPIIDSFGRVIFSRWDHLQRDQQVGNDDFAPFNYASEAEKARRIASTAEVFPEPLSRDDEDLKATQEPHRFNHFFPWMMHQDGSGLETLNHIGRQELHGYIPRALNNDPNLDDFYGQTQRFNQNSILNMFQIKESPVTAGLYYGVDAPEFGTHAAGQIIAIQGDPSILADQMAVQYITSRATASTDETPGADHSGLYRDPLPLSDGSIVAAHTVSTLQDSNTGTTAAPASRYTFRLRTLRTSGGTHVPDEFLTSGITKTISYWNPDVLVTYNNVTMWELQPTAVLPRTRPAAITSSIPAPEQSILDELSVSSTELVNYLKHNDLALIVSRDVTTRDRLDVQQPFNIKVAGTSTQTIGASGKIYPVSFLQLFQGDLIRGYGGTSSPERGRRVLANLMHDVTQNPTVAGAPASSVKIGDDGSLAAFVPARRALTWHLTDASGNSVVKERYWVTFQPGEIRVCASCHGVNSFDQAEHTAPTNPPQALSSLLRHWRGLPQATPIPDPSAGGKPKVTLLASILPKSRGSNPSHRVRVTVTSTNRAAIGKLLTLKATLSGSDCVAAEREFKAKKTSVTMTILAPQPKRTTVLKISVNYNGTAISSKRVILGASSKARAKANSCPRVTRSASYINGQ